MGFYNPTAPSIIGEQWVPIRPEPTPLDTAREIGNGFVLPASEFVEEARVYLYGVPARTMAGQTILTAVYPRGTEGMSGPMRRIVVPVDSGVLTGNVALGGGAANTPAALNASTDGRHLSFTGTGTARLHFNTNTFSTELVDQRILSVRLLYVLAGDLGAVDGVTSTVIVGSGPGSLAPAETTFPYADASLLTAAPTLATAAGFNVVDMGELNPWWDYPTNAWTDTSERLPWRREELLRLEAGASNPVGVMIETVGLTSELQLGYAALEVLYCTEQRIVYGGTAFGPAPQAGPSSNPYTLDNDANITTMRDTGFTAGPLLDPGPYTVTVKIGNIGALATAGDTPTVNALRQLYPMPDHPGIAIDTPGVRSASELRREETAGGGAPVRVEVPIDPTALVTTVLDVLPHVTLHDDNGVLPGVHVYGASFPAAVYDDVSQAQQLQPAVADGSAYPFVRFWARSFGATIPLTVQFHPSAAAAATATAQLMPAAFADLPEIVTGWKEITLAWDVPPVITPDPTNVPRVVFSAPGLVRESQWQVLTADAMGGTGADANGPSSYGDPDGDDFELVQIIGGSPDPQDNVDAVVMLSQEPPEVTDLAVTVETLPLAGIGTACDQPTLSVPTGVYYHEVTWTPVPYPAQLIADLFRRNETNQWGTADLGGPWTNLGGAPSDFGVIDFDGAQHYIDTGNGRLFSVIGAGIDDAVLDTDMAFSPGPGVTDGPLEMAIVGRFVDVNNHYRFQTSHITPGGVTMTIERVSGGVTTTLATTSIGVTTNAVRLIARMNGPVLSVTWVGFTNEPSVTIGATDATHPAGAVGLAAYLDPANTSGPYTVDYTAFSATGLTPPILEAFGYYELQRRDEVDTDWQTIGIASSPDTARYADYEARVGVESTYRVRVCNSYDFCGEFSTEAVSTIPAPGVTGQNVDFGVLVFSSNERQDGSAVLAYVMSWESRPPVEEFTLPEAGTALLQRMYERDYVTAFRPLERGGMRFTRNLMIQGAAVAPPVLDAGFRSLRDLAWHQLSYVAVRTEAADRWLSTVLVPSGTFRDLRRLQVAAVEIIQVTDTPSPVELTACEGMVSGSRTVYAQTAHRSAFAGFAEEIDVRVRVRMDNWVIPGPTSTADLVSNYHPDFGGGFELYFVSGGMTFTVDDGIDFVFFSSDVVLADPGEELWLRVVWERDNGSGDSEATFYTSVDGVVWTPAGGPSTSPDQPSIVGTGPLVVGGSPFFLSENEGVTIAEAVVMDTGGIVYASPLFDAQPAGTTVFADDQGNRWELVGGGTCTR